MKFVLAPHHAQVLSLLTGKTGRLKQHSTHFTHFTLYSVISELFAQFAIVNTQDTSHNETIVIRAVHSAYTQHNAFDGDTCSASKQHCKILPKINCGLH